MQAILSWCTALQQLSWWTISMPRFMACGGQSMSWDTTSREAAGSSHHTPQSAHATSGQCMCMKRFSGSTGQRWSISQFFFQDQWLEKLCPFYPLLREVFSCSCGLYCLTIMFFNAGSPRSYLRKTKDTNTGVC